VRGRRSSTCGWRTSLGVRSTRAHQSCRPGSCTRARRRARSGIICPQERAMTRSSILRRGRQSERFRPVALVGT
jgi:hypothetical protein